LQKLQLQGSKFQTSKELVVFYIHEIEKRRTPTLLYHTRTNDNTSLRHVKARAGCYLPVELRREELGDQSLVVWLELFGVHWLVALGVKVVRIECAGVVRLDRR
jgi:hypothetical protein